MTVAGQTLELAELCQHITDVQTYTSGHNCCTNAFARLMPGIAMACRKHIAMASTLHCAAKQCLATRLVQGGNDGAIVGDALTDLAAAVTPGWRLLASGRRV